MTPLGSLGSLWLFRGGGGWGGGEVFFRVGVELFDAGFAAQFDDLTFVGDADGGAIVTTEGIPGDDAFGGVCRECASGQDQGGGGEQAAGAQAAARPAITASCFRCSAGL